LLTGEGEREESKEKEKGGYEQTTGEWVESKQRKELGKYGQGKMDSIFAFLGKHSNLRQSRCAWN
jgi:hypothetical protein